jgi:hypothetical protein
VNSERSPPQPSSPARCSEFGDQFRANAAAAGGRRLGVAGQLGGGRWAGGRLGGGRAVEPATSAAPSGELGTSRGRAARRWRSSSVPALPPVVGERVGPTSTLVGAELLPVFE